MHPAYRIITGIPAILESDYPQFYVGTIENPIPDGIKGISIDAAYVRDNPLLRTTVLNGVTFRFVAVNPVSSWTGLTVIQKNDPIISLRELANKQRDSITRRPVAISLYAEWTSRANEISEIFENALDAETDSPQVMELVHQLLSDGFSASCEFIDILRRKFAQYWLAYPDNLLAWSTLLYFSKSRGSWHRLQASTDFVDQLSEASARNHHRQIPHPLVMLRTLTANDAPALDVAKPVTPFSFEEEMMATALVDLSQNRTRSAIVHAVIALESVAKQSLELLVSSRLTGLEQGRVLEAISKEISTITLARTVCVLLLGETGSAQFDWEKLKQLYDLRNTIIHRNRRRLPDFEKLKDWLIEVYRYVQVMDDKLRESETRLDDSIDS